MSLLSRVQRRHLMAVRGLGADQLAMDVVVETQTDSDLLFDAERLQTEDAAVTRLGGGLHDVDVEGM